AVCLHSLTEASTLRSRPEYSKVIAQPLIVTFPKPLRETPSLQRLNLYSPLFGSKTRKLPVESSSIVISWSNLTGGFVGWIIGFVCPRTDTHINETTNKHTNHNLCIMPPELLFDLSNIHGSPCPSVREGSRK